MKKFLEYSALILFSLFIFDINLSPADTPNEITLSAAISLKNAFEEMGKAFEAKHPGTKIRFNFGASGDLVRQIEGGAPVDAFASAAQKDMDEMDQKGFITSGTRANFAGNSMVLIKSPLSRIRIESFEDLRKSEVTKIAIGNPKSVPAGRYAQEILRWFHLWDATKEKLVFGEHARQVLDYAARNEVDAAIVYSTDAMLRSKEISVLMKAPPEAHEPIIYPIAVVKGSKDPILAKEFIVFALSAEGSHILKKYGFETLK